MPAVNLPCAYSFATLSIVSLISTAADAADAESPLKDSELAVLRKQYEAEGQFVGVQTRFNYAWGLIKSNRRSEQQLGVRLLTDIFRDHAERRRECLYYLALGHYKLGNYAEARRYNDTLLKNEPGNLQAQSLRGLIDDKVARGAYSSCSVLGNGELMLAIEGLLGVAIVSGVALAAGLVGSAMWKGLSRKR